MGWISSMKLHNIVLGLIAVMMMFTSPVFGAIQVYTSQNNSTIINFSHGNLSSLTATITDYATLSNPENFDRSNLVAEWNFDDNLTDTSGNNYNGTGTNINYIPVKYNNGAFFNNTSSITISKFSIPNTTGVISYSFWSNTSKNTGAGQTFLSHGENSTGTLWLYRPKNTDTLTLEYATGADPYALVQKVGYFSSYSGFPIYINVIVDYINSTTSFYRNGIFVSSSVMTTPQYPSNNLTKYLGSFDGSTNKIANGSMDDFKIETRNISSEIPSRYYSKLQELTITATGNGTTSTKWNSTLNNPLNVPVLFTDTITGITYNVPETSCIDNICIHDYNNTTMWNTTLDIINNYTVNVQTDNYNATINGDTGVIDIYDYTGIYLFSYGRVEIANTTGSLSYSNGSFSTTQTIINGDDTTVYVNQTINSTINSATKYSFNQHDSKIIVNNSLNYTTPIYINTERITLFNASGTFFMWNGSSTLTSVSKASRYSPMVGNISFTNSLSSAYVYGTDYNTTGIEYMDKTSDGYRLYSYNDTLHPFITYLDDSGNLLGSNYPRNYAYRTGINYATTVLDIKSAPKYFLMKHRFYRNYLGAMTMTDDSDFQNVSRVSSVYYGTDNINSPDYGNKGLVGHNLKITTTVFTNGGDNNGIGIVNDTFRTLINSLHNYGYEIALHTPSNLADNRTVVNESISFFTQYYPLYDWIDHAQGTNCTINPEDISCHGTISGNSTYYNLDLLLNISTFKYSSPDGLMGDGEFAFNSPSQLPHFSYRVHNTSYPQTYVYGRESSKSWNDSDIGFEIYWDESNISKLISENELSIVYIHWAYPTYGAYFFNATSGYLEILPEVDERFDYIQSLQDNGALWVAPTREIFDYLLNLEQVQIINQSASGNSVNLSVINTLNKSIDGVSLKISSDNISSVQIGNNYDIYVNNSIVTLPSFNISESKDLFVIGGYTYSTLLPQLTTVSPDVKIFNANYNGSEISVTLNWTGYGINNSTFVVNNTHKVFIGTNITNSIESNKNTISYSNLSINQVTITQGKFSVFPSSDSINVTVSTWNTTNGYYKKWNESSSNHSVTTQHTIGDFPVNTLIQVKKNGVNWNTYTSNGTGYITFNYTDGYSDIQFEASISDNILITSWSNDYTSNNTTSFSVDTGTTVIFNTTANQTISSCTWNGATPINCSGNSSYASKVFTTGVNTVQSYSSTANGSSQTITWTVSVNNTLSCSPTISILFGLLPLLGTIMIIYYLLQFILNPIDISGMISIALIAIVGLAVSISVITQTVILTCPA